jgi:5-methyltetrahydropteroyltriglutamate--homocysteine methyltransferase
VAYQLALALQDEIRDYEKEGIRIVQVDEPAIREKSPIKKKDWKEYFEWAVKAFNLATNTSSNTQIHIHLCYSDFMQIMPFLLKMDFDVITIESARGGLDILKAFQDVKFSRQIGLGVWDIHSPRIPKVNEMKVLIKKCAEVFGVERFWVNPDCGLKTRKWDEVDASLANMVEAVKQVKVEQKTEEAKRCRK